MRKNIEEIRRKVIPILKKNKVVRAGIFGSYAKGKESKRSDVDIIIQPPKKMGLGFVGLKFELEDKLGKKIDLITYQSIHPLLKKQILDDEIKLL